MSEAITGSCHCGAIKFLVTRELTGVIHCHCSDCRRWHGHHSAYAVAMLADLGPLSRRLLDLLEERGACFFADLELACQQGDSDGATSGPATHEDLVQALWDLVWVGLVTNDTFQPLRALAMRRTRSPRRRRGTDLRCAGRWSVVGQLIAAAVEPTERAHARAVMLLERHGIVSREAASLEALPGGFSAVYPVLRAMEEAGKVRRGYFVEGIGGAQFALPGAVERLRRLKAPGGQPGGQPAVTVLSAADPPTPMAGSCPGPIAASRSPVSPSAAAAPCSSSSMASRRSFSTEGARPS